MKILITGGAGFIGSHLAEAYLNRGDHVYVIDDLSTGSIRNIEHLKVRKEFCYIIDSIMNKSVIAELIDDADIIFHLAAAKNIEITEYNPIETINTNINGIINLIKMTIKNKPEKFINLSTDKAANPTTLYGSTKQIAEQLTSWATANHTKFASIRFGNVFETRGNVFELWEEEAKNNKPLSITSTKMERYYIEKDKAISWILKCFLLAKNGEIFVPKLKSFKMIDLANSISKKHKVIGSRYGEKIKETLITEQEKIIAKETKEMWIVKQHTRD